MEDVPQAWSLWALLSLGIIAIIVSRRIKCGNKWLRDLNSKQRKSSGVSATSQDVALTQQDIPEVKTTVRGRRDGPKVRKTVGDWRDGPEVKTANCSCRDPS